MIKSRAVIGQMKLAVKVKVNYVTNYHFAFFLTPIYFLDILGFKCPEQDTQNRYWPYPRYWYNTESLVTCVRGQPRLIHCGNNTYVDDVSLICVPYERN